MESEMDDRFLMLLQWMRVEREKAVASAKLMENGSQFEFDRGAAYAFQVSIAAAELLIKPELKNDEIKKSTS